MGRSQTSECQQSQSRQRNKDEKRPTTFSSDPFQRQTTFSNIFVMTKKRQRPWMFIFSSLKSKALCHWPLTTVSGALIQSPTNEINWDTSKKLFCELGKLCYFCQFFGSRESLRSRFSPTKSSRNPSSVGGGDILSYELLGKVHGLKPGGSQDGVCATSVAAEETATPLRWLVFPRDELLKMTHYHHQQQQKQRLNIFFSLTTIQENISILLSPLKMQETMKCEVCWQGHGTNLFTSGSYI